MPPKTHAVVLAGGKGRRMGGQDKGLVEAHGKHLVNYVCDAISGQVDHLMISANRHRSVYEQTGFDVIGDNVGDFAGPLAGILSALAHVEKNELLFCYPCDMPAVPEQIVVTLREKLLIQQTDICCLQIQDRLQPLISIMHERVQPGLNNYLKSGHHKVMDWIKQLDMSVLILQEQHAPDININNQRDLKRFLGYLTP